MDHLALVDDAAVKDAVDLFQAQIELLVLQLLDPDHDTAIAQISAAREHAIGRIKNITTGLVPISEHDAKTVRIAVAMLAKTYNRLFDTIEHQHDVPAQNGSFSQRYA
jgi:hypothetical protein